LLEARRILKGGIKSLPEGKGKNKKSPVTKRKEISEVQGAVRFWKKRSDQESKGSYQVKALKQSEPNRKTKGGLAILRVLKSLGKQEDKTAALEK